MARFCTNCGSPVEETVKFCPHCGSQLGEPLAPTPVVQPAPAPVTGQQTATAAPPQALQAGNLAGAPVPAAARKGSPVVPIILGVLGFFALVSVIGIVSCVYIGYRIKQKADQWHQSVKVDESGKSITFNTPQGQINIEETKSGEAARNATKDVPPYPGSIPLEGGGGISFGAQAAISGQAYETPGSVDQVVAFYKERLGPKATLQESEGKAVLMVSSATGMTTVSIEPDEKTGKTKISIGRIGK
jgi:hypothetical protein